MDNVEIRLIFWLPIFWIKAVTMATSHLMTERYYDYQLSKARQSLVTRF